MIQVGIFARPPVPGQTKTRLIPDLGAHKASEVYRYCLEHTLAAVRQSGLDYQLFLTGDSSDPVFQGEAYRLQKGADLGDRMVNAMQEMLDSGRQGAIIIGTDCLDLTGSHLRQAARALADHELVLTPALDGGFALIGCSEIDTRLFAQVEWSSEQVYRQTADNADSLGYRLHSLETVRDIDTLQDLKHYPELVALVTPN